MTVSADIAIRRPPALVASRAALGLAQGVALWFLISAARTHGWPATAPYLFAPVLAITLAAPVAAMMTLSSLRPATLSAWLGAVVLFVGLVGLHEALRFPMSPTGPTLPGVRMSVGTAVAAALFIAQALAVAGDDARKLIAPYPAYFDVAWKQELQLLLSVVFVGLLWGVLWLGAALFDLVEIKFLRELITRPAFALPASTLAFACALHVTDVQVRMVQGARNLLHILLSWLLPLAVVLIVGFLAALPLTGLAPLWRTSHGSEIVLTAAAVLIVLINAVYRDGGDAAPPALLRWGASLAALALPVLVAISAYGLALRVAQRGWTETRIVAMTCVVVGACYAAGYAWAAIAGRPWLRRLEITNIATAFVILIAIATLATVADPARLAVADQVARLEAGRVSPDKFDFKYLRFDAGRYGLAALDNLKTAAGANADAIRKQVEVTSALTSRYAAQPPSEVQLSAMPVYPAGKKLPDDFLQQISKPSSDNSRSWCLTNAKANCEAFITADAGGGEIIILAGQKDWENAWAFARDASAIWQPLGTVNNAIHCPSVRQALRAGQYHWVAPQRNELEAAGRRLTITPPYTQPTCR